MNSMNRIATLIFISLSLAAWPVVASQVGDTLLAFTLKNQAGKSQTLDDSVLRIYANGDRGGDKLLEAAMKGLDQTTLDAQQAIVVADISAAPGFVKGIIRSGLKDRPYSTWIDESGSTRQSLPYRADRVTVIELEQRKITAIRFVADAEDLKQELATVPAPAPAPEAESPETTEPAADQTPTDPQAEE